MSWQPDQQELEQILQLIRQSKSEDVATQNYVQRRLEELNNFPNFNNYLAFILAKMTNEGIK